MMDTVEKKQNYVLHTVTGLILLILTGVKFSIGEIDIEGLLALGRFAMPFFFIISGYYLYSDDGHSEASLPRKIKHILLLTIVIKALYLVIDVIYYSAGVITMDYLLTAFLTSEDTTLHIWFVYALLLLYVWWWIMLRYEVNIWRVSSTLSIIMLVVCLMFGVVLRIWGINEIGGVSSLTINEHVYPFIGITFFTAGYYLHKHHGWFDRVFGTKLLVLLTALGMLFPLVMAKWIPHSTLYFGSVPAAIGLFMLTYRVPEGRLRCRFTEFLGRSLKPFLYAYFPATVFFVKNVVLMNMTQDLTYYALGSVLSVMINLALSYLTYRLVRHIGGSKRRGTAS